MMNGQLPPQQVYDGNIQVSVSLTLNTWNTVLNMIAEAPWKTADPLMQEIRKQIGQVLENQPSMAQPGTELRQ